MSEAPSVLLVAFHFPPLAGSSGIQRTLRFVQHLPAFGWQPLVLSADPRAYERCNDDLMNEVPPGTVVRRAFALDTARHLSFRGRYIGAFARPDRWISWRFDALRQGLQLIRQYRPDAIWSTYPIATAHVIGAELARRSGLPWIADFRDPMAQDGYPADPATWQRYRRIEDHAVHHAALSTFTTPGAAAEYARRYPQAGPRIRVLENGYDEESFAGAAAVLEELPPLNAGALTLLHSGIVYPSERDPVELFAALRVLHDEGSVHPGRLKFRFRAAVAEDLLRRLGATYGVGDYIEVLPALPYREALAEMLRADGLLLLQASNCNAQVPAKLYEYLRARRPIVCLSDPGGDTIKTLQRSGVSAHARLDDAADIARLLRRFLNGTALQDHLADEASVVGASRVARTRELAGMLDAVSAPAAGSAS